MVFATTDKVLPSAVAPETLSLPPMFAVFATISPVFGASANNTPPILALPVLVSPKTVFVK